MVERVKNGDLQALGKLENLGQQNNIYALANLGCMYENGKGVDVNYPKAIEYYQKSADLGNSNALLALAKTNEEKENTTLAVDYYQRYIENNREDTNTLTYSAILEYDNVSADRDEIVNEVIGYLELAVELDNENALYCLVRVLHREERYRSN